MPISLLRFREIACHLWSFPTMLLKNWWVSLVRPFLPLSWNPRTICHWEGNVSEGLGGHCLSLYSSPASSIVSFTNYPFPFRTKAPCWEAVPPHAPPAPTPPTPPPTLLCLCLCVCPSYLRLFHIIFMTIEHTLSTLHIIVCHYICESFSLCVRV